MVQEINIENINEIRCSFLKNEDILNEFNNNPFAKYLVYIVNGMVLGYLYYSEIYERVEINQIEVDYCNRNRGIGTILLKRLTEIVEKDISLEVREDNIPALTLYRKFNFSQVAIRKSYYNGLDGILMIRKFA